MSGRIFAALFVASFLIGCGLGVGAGVISDGVAKDFQGLLVACFAAIVAGGFLLWAALRAWLLAGRG